MSKAWIGELRKLGGVLAYGAILTVLFALGFFLWGDLSDQPTEREKAIVRARVEQGVGIRRSIEDRIDAVHRAFVTTLKILEERNPGNDIVPPIRDDLMRKRGQIDNLLDDLEELLREYP